MTALQKLIDLEPDVDEHVLTRAELHERLARTFEDRAQTDPARTHYQEALTLLDGVATKVGDPATAGEARLRLRESIGDLELNAGHKDAARQAYADGLTAADALLAAQPESESFGRFRKRFSTRIKALAP